MKALVKFGLVVGMLMSLTACGFQKVDTGHRGVKVTYGKVVSESLPEDMYFYNPFSSDIVEMDVRILKWEAATQAYTKDVQQATVNFVLNYRLDPSRAHIMYREVGKDWSEKLVGQVVVESIKREVGQHEAVDMVSQRDKAARSIETEVKEKLMVRDVIVTNFQLTNIDYTPEFEHAVEAKVVAQQKAIEEANRTKQIEEQKTQAILRAEGEAESIRIRANALAQNAKLVEWEAVQKWDGKMPQYMLGGATPFINIK